MRENLLKDRILLPLMMELTDMLDDGCWTWGFSNVLRRAESSCSWDFWLLFILDRRTIWNSHCILNKDGKWVTILLDQLALMPKNLIITTFWIYLKPFTVQKLTLSRERKRRQHSSTEKYVTSAAVGCPVCLFVCLGLECFQLSKQKKKWGGGWFRMIRLCVFTIMSKPWIQLLFGIYKI